MKRIVLLLILGFVFLSGSGSAVSYDFTVEPNGETFVNIVVDTPLILPLPEQIDELVVTGSYMMVDEGLQIDSEVPVEITYTSSYHTRKEEGLWYFDANLVEDSQAQLQINSKVQIVQSAPRAIIESSDITDLRWDKADDLQVSFVTIRSESRPVALPPYLNKSVNVPWLLIFIGMGIIGLFFVFKTKKKEIESEDSGSDDKRIEESDHDDHLPTITAGQMNVIRAANPNDALVLKITLKHNGHIKRNLLEKETHLSKSSLASTINSLEKKNILVIDRSFHVHYIMLSDWFKSLK